MPDNRLKFFGWGRTGEGMTPEEEEAFVLERYRARFGVDEFDALPPPALSDIHLRPPRITPPAAVASICSTELYDRVAHIYGKSYPDTVHGLLGAYENAPDVVAYPRGEAELVAVMDWAGGAQAVMTPIAAGGTITHHHAVGRDHRPWYDKQRPALFAAALRAAHRELDPQGLLNPGVLIDP